jgi:chloramphenicol O-acetyltransferase type A
MITNPKFKTVDLANDPKKKEFAYFSKIYNPYTSVTVNVDITSFMKKIKERNLPFFLSFLFCVLNAADDVTDLRRRIKGDNVVEFDHSLGSFTLALEDGSFTFCTVDKKSTIEEFVSEGLKEEKIAKENPEIADHEENTDSMIFISCLPWLSYISHTMETPYPPDSNPRITWGKYFLQQDRYLIPLTLVVNHGIADGRDMGLFYQALDKRLAEI